MKFIVIALLASVLSISATVSMAAEPIIDSSKAAFYVGSEVMVCGVVHEIKKFSKGTYLNMGSTYPHQHISVLIWNSDVNEFNNRFGNLIVFQGSQACASGLIEKYRNALQIKVSNPQFLRLMK